MGARQPRRGLLMTHLEEFWIVACPVQRPENPVDAITGIPEQPLHLPRLEVFDDKIRDCFLCWHPEVSSHDPLLRLSMSVHATPGAT
jgi:hypothetical protein